MAAATSSTTSPIRPRPSSTRRSSSPALFRGCRYFHVMGSSLFSARIAAAVRRGVELARAAGARISFDPNIRKELLALPEVATTIAGVLEVTDLLLPSEADLDHLCPGQSEAQAVAGLLAAGRQMVLLKKGAQGSVYYDAQNRIATPAFPAEEVDPTGAGDCFGGTFVACLALGLPVERALRLANAAGALAVGRKGPMEGNSSMAELETYPGSTGHEHPAHHRRRQSRREETGHLLGVLGPSHGARGLHRPGGRGRRAAAGGGDLQPGQPGGRLHRHAAGRVPRLRLRARRRARPARRAPDPRR